MIKIKNRSNKIICIDSDNGPMSIVPLSVFEVETLNHSISKLVSDGVFKVIEDTSKIEKKSKSDLLTVLKSKKDNKGEKGLQPTRRKRRKRKESKT